MRKKSFCCLDCFQFVCIIQDNHKCMLKRLNATGNGPVNEYNVHCANNKLILKPLVYSIKYISPALLASCARAHVRCNGAPPHVAWVAL